MEKLKLNANALFNALRAEAKLLGINTKGMKKPDIEQAIRDVQAKFEEENGDTSDTIEVVPIETVEVITPTSTTTVVVEGVTTVEVKRLGRPVDPTSPRQIRLAEAAKLREEGKLKRGRPMVDGCARQKRLAERAERIANGTGTGKPGRPKMIKPIIPFVAVEDVANAPIGIAVENELPKQD